MTKRLRLIAMLAVGLAGCSAPGGSPASGAPALQIKATTAQLRIAGHLNASLRVVPAPRSVAALSMVSTHVGFAVAEPPSGGPGELLYTSDGGSTWTRRTRLGEQVDELQFLDADHGFAASPAGLFATADGGRTWTARARQKFSAIRFVSPQDGIAATQQGVLETTTDGGAAWTPQLAAARLYFTSVSALPGPVYYALGGDRGSAQSGEVSLYVSRDGGRDWTRLFDGISSPGLRPAYRTYVAAQIPSSAGQLPTFDQGGSVVFTSPAVGWIALLDGAFLSTMVARTEDGGRTWTYEWGNSGCAMGCHAAGGGLYPAAFLGSNDVWRYDGQAVDRSTDGGSTFVKGSPLDLGMPPSQAVHTMQFVSPDVGLAASSYGILRTTDGGRTWSRAWPEGPGSLSRVSMTASGFGLAVSSGQPDLLWRTLNGGKAWTALRIFAPPRGGANQAQGAAPVITSFWAFAGGRGLVDADGRLYATTDRGATWRAHAMTKPPAGPYSQPAVTFASLTDGWALSRNGSSNTLYRTTDGGRTWAKGAAMRSGPTACQEVGSAGWCLTGTKDPSVAPTSWKTELLATTDRGRHFTEVGWLPMVAAGSALSFPSAAAGVLLGPEGLLLTKNAGKTFRRITIQLSDNDVPVQVDAVSADEIYVLTGEGQLIVTRDGGKSWRQLL